MISQLFYKKPDTELINKLINIIGYDNIYSNKIIYVSDMEQRNVLSNISNIIEEIKDNYIHCKQKYCEQLTLKKCISLTRQHLKTINYDLISNVYYINSKRERGYRIIPLNQKTFIKNKMEIEIKFD
jgi:hypothetical protein